MSFEKYIVKKGDSLEKIANKFGISQDELRLFHNSHCELSDLLSYKDNIPNHVKVILMPFGRQTNHEKRKNTNSHFLLGNDIYEIKINNLFFVKDELMSENSAENLWKIKQDIPNSKVELEVIDIKINKYDSQLKGLVQIIQKINKATDRLELSLHKDGSIIKVLNMSEILEKWSIIRVDELKLEELIDDSIKLLLDEYDKSFQNITKFVQEDLLYQLVFCPKNPMIYPLFHPEIIKENISVKSFLFPQQSIQYDLSYISEDKNNYLLFSLKSIVNSDHLSHFKELYDKNYSSLLEAPFQPEFFLEGSYLYDKLTEKLEYANVYVKEQMSEELIYITQYKIINLTSKSN